MNALSCIAAVVLVPAVCFARTGVEIGGPSGGSGGSGSSSPMLVTASWMAEHLEDPLVLVFHVAQNRNDYRNGHIPGARFLWSQALSVTDPDLTLELPSLAQADSVLNNLGVSERATIVLYFSESNVTSTTRVYLTLDHLGLADHVSFLDGGLEAWKAAGHPVSKETTPSLRGNCVFRPKEITVDWQWLRENLNNPKVSIVDARGAQFYAGNGGGMPRAGHIPNAVNIPFSSVVDSTNKLKDIATLRSLFATAGIAPGNTVVTYCHIGQQASLIYFVAKYLGYDARLYDGSYEDWSGRLDLPVISPQGNESKRK